MPQADTSFRYSAAQVEQPAAGQDIVLIVFLLAVLLFFLVRNMASFRGLKIRGPDGKPTESETEGGTTTQGEEEEEEEEELEDEEDTNVAKED